MFGSPPCPVMPPLVASAWPATGAGAATLLPRPPVLFKELGCDGAAAFAALLVGWSPPGRSWGGREARPPSPTTT
jgi:hypothetical protein